VVGDLSLPPLHLRLSAARILHSDTVTRPIAHTPFVKSLKPTALRVSSSLLLILGIVLFASCSRPSSQSQKVITVAAASDLTAAFEELGRSFEQQSGTKVVFSFGSTGMLTQQIINGAPMDVFAAANVSFIEQLERQNLILPDTKAVYARGRITLWTRKEAAFKPSTIADLTRTEVKRVAIANPDHAPYGLAAKQALESVGIWEEVKPKIVYAENIRQTLQFAATGNVDVAIVALSLTLNSDGQWVLIPEESHRPLDQALAVIKSTKNEAEARQFASYVTSDAGRAILSKYGFTLN
jgi:molybdate transport system substrate-binding protein